MLLHLVLSHTTHSQCLTSQITIRYLSGKRQLTKILWTSSVFKCGPDSKLIFGLPSFRPNTNGARINKTWSKSVIKTCLLTCAAVGLFLAGLTYRTIQNINKTFPVFSGKHGNLKKEALFIPWLQSHSHDLATLLSLCQSDDRNVRQLGIQGLALVDGWPDWEYYLASMLIDKQTLIGLARTKGANPRLFPKKPKMPSFKVNIMSQLKMLLSELPTEDTDKCTKYYTTSVLKDRPEYSIQEKTMMWTFDDNDFLQLETISSEKEDKKQELLCLLALEGHSKLLDHSIKVAELGGLELMQRLYEIRQNDIDVVRQTARILANLTQFKTLHDDIVEAGWIPILFEWINSEDFAISVYATKALANLDQDTAEQRLYPDSIYLYYPQFRFRQPLYADVIFVHGLLGGPFRTWRQDDCMRPKAKPTNQINSSAESDKTECRNGVLQRENTSNLDKAASTESYTMCWPKDWLAKDCPNIRILTVEYETYISDWTPKPPYENERRTLSTRSRDLLQKLHQCGVGSRPVIWIAHSMGGLLVKQMLLLAKDDESVSDILHRTKGILFYSVPHKGSPLAMYMNRTKYLLYPSVEVKQLYPGSKQLLDLHEKFRNLLQTVHIPLLSFGEGSKTNLPFNLKAMFVPVESSDPGLGEFHLMMDHTHLNICKPVNRDSLLYQQTLAFIHHSIPQYRIDEILKANMPEDYIFPYDLSNESSR